jgi:hypothetical protein
MIEVRGVSHPARSKLFIAAVPLEIVLTAEQPVELSLASLRRHVALRERLRRRALSATVSVRRVGAFEVTG